MLQPRDSSKYFAVSASVAASATAAATAAASVSPCSTQIAGVCHKFQVRKKWMAE